MSLFKKPSEALALFWLSGAPWELEFIWYLKACFDIKMFFIDAKQKVRTIVAHNPPMHKLFFDDYASFKRSHPCPGFKTVAAEPDHSGIPIYKFNHPTKALYLFGGDNMSLPKEVYEEADYQIYLEGKNSYYVSTAASLIFYHRFHNRRGRI